VILLSFFFLMKSTIYIGKINIWTKGGAA